MQNTEPTQFEFIEIPGEDTEERATRHAHRREQWDEDRNGIYRLLTDLDKDRAAVAYESKPRYDLILEVEGEPFEMSSYRKWWTARLNVFLLGLFLIISYQTGRIRLFDRKIKKQYVY